MLARSTLRRSLQPYATRTRVDQRQSSLARGRFLGFPGSDRRRPAHWALGIDSLANSSLNVFLYRFLLSCHQKERQHKASAPGGKQDTDVIHVRSSIVLNAFS